MLSSAKEVLLIQLNVQEVTMLNYVLLTVKVKPILIAFTKLMLIKEVI